MSKRQPTATQKIAQQNLRAIWQAKKKQLGLTQELAAHLLGWNSQGSVASYLNGRIPLNTDAILKFAELLEVDPREIDPSRAVVIDHNRKETYRSGLTTHLAEDEAEPALPGHARQLINLIERRVRDGSLTKEHTAVLKSSLELMTGKR